MFSYRAWHGRSTFRAVGVGERDGAVVQLWGGRSTFRAVGVGERDGGVVQLWGGRSTFRAVGVGERDGSGLFDQPTCRSASGAATRAGSIRLRANRF